MQKRRQVDVHPAATIFPMMKSDEFAGLKADIETNGLRDPLVFWNDQLLDGRNRLKACDELGIDAFSNSEELEPGTDPVAWVLSHNLHRRHLTTSQRSMVAAKLAKLKPGEVGNGRPKVETSIGVPTIEDAAQLLSVSASSVDRAKKVIDEGSKELVAMVESGEVSLHKAVETVTAHDKKSQAAAAREKPKPKSKPSNDEGVVARFKREFWDRLDDDERALIRVFVINNTED